MAAEKGLVIANEFAAKIQECMELDEKLRDEFHELNDAKWDGLASASHIGFCNWNDEESKNPIIETVIPVKKSRLAVGVCESGESTCGEDWTRKRLFSKRLLDTREESTEIFVGLCSDHAVDFAIACDDDRIRIETEKGTVTPEKPLERITLTLQKDRLYTSPEKKDNPVVNVSYGNACAQIEVLLPDAESADIVNNMSGENIFVEADGIICMHADHYAESYEQDGEHFETLADIAKVASGVKLYTEADSPVSEDPSWLAYDFCVQQEGEYELIIETEPASARKYCGRIQIGYRMNEDKQKCLEMLPKGYEPGVSGSWEVGVLDHVRRVSAKVNCVHGKNRLKVYALSGENVIERIMIVRKDKEVPLSYLGPAESIKM